MKLRKVFRTAALTAALGFGVWSLAVTFQAAGFSDGDTLSAAELNDLLNHNFDAAETAITDLETDVSALETGVTSLEGAVSSLETGKFDSSGGAISGRTALSGPASSPSTGTPSSLLYVNNSGSTGSAGVFQSNNDSDNGAVSIKQQGAGPALTLKSNGGGPLISGAGQVMVTFVVEDTGTIRIGDMGTDGLGDPTLTLDAEAGTITNDVGSGLPLAFGYVSASGNKESGTDNFTVVREGDDYRISLTGENYSRNGYATIVQHTSPTARMSRATDNDGDILVTIYNSGGSATGAAFHFVTYKDGL